MAGVARSYMEVTWCKFMQARASFGVASRRQVEQRRGGKAERRTLVIIHHVTDIVCSFHCQIIDCYDLNECLTIVRLNRFSPTFGSISPNPYTQRPDQFVQGRDRGGKQFPAKKVSMTVHEMFVTIGLHQYSVDTEGRHRRQTNLSLPG